MVWTLAVFLYSYLKIVRKFKERACGLPGNATGQENCPKFVHYNKQLTKTYMTMLLVFLSCYMPSGVMAYFMNFCTMCSCGTIHHFRDFHLLLVLLNSALNPFVYALRFAKFRRAVFKILHINFTRSREKQESASDTTPNSLFYLSLQGDRVLNDSD